MSPSVEEICEEILSRVTPRCDERKRILEMARELKQKVREASEKEGLEAEVEVEGSVAKDTWLSGDPEIDIFIQVPKTMPREAFGSICLEIGRRVTKGHKQVERFAEHPYLESMINGVTVNIVPCYIVKRGKWISATDRTPFHTDYVKNRLNLGLQGEVRLLKRFMKGIGVYGAEIRVGGFSGYLCELLIIRYGSFVETLRSVADWRERVVIDHEEYYKGRENRVNKKFEERLIVVDPVDKERNVAAAVRKEKQAELIAAARSFLQSPHQRFFYPEELKIFNGEKLVQTFISRGSTIVFVRFGRVKAVPDVLWGQLYKSQRSLRKVLQHHDFRILRDRAWSDEEELNILIFEVERRFLQPIKKHLGPPIEKKEECEKFLRKHLKAPHTISGPRVEGGRWVVEIQRKYTDIVDFLKLKLKDGGRHVGVASLISRAILNKPEILVNKEILRLYSASLEFARFLTEYLEGKPRWLE